MNGPQRRHAVAAEGPIPERGSAEPGSVSVSGSADAFAGHVLLPVLVSLVSTPLPPMAAPSGDDKPALQPAVAALVARHREACARFNMIPGVPYPSVATVARKKEAGGKESASVHPSLHAPSASSASSAAADPAAEDRSSGQCLADLRAALSLYDPALTLVVDSLVDELIVEHCEFDLLEQSCSHLCSDLHHRYYSDMGSDASSVGDSSLLSPPEASAQQTTDSHLSSAVPSASASLHRRWPSEAADANCEGAAGSRPAALAGGPAASFSKLPKREGRSALPSRSPTAMHTTAGTASGDAVGSSADAVGKAPEAGEYFSDDEDGDDDDDDDDLVDDDGNEGPSSSSSTGLKRRRNLSRHATDVLNRWFFLHLYDPYPTDEEKARLAQDAGLTLNQCNNWFGNKRMRYKRKMLDQARRSQQIQQQQQQQLTAMAGSKAAFFDHGRSPRVASSAGAAGVATGAGVGGDGRPLTLPMEAGAATSFRPSDGAAISMPEDAVFAAAGAAGRRRRVRGQKLSRGETIADVSAGSGFTASSMTANSAPQIGSSGASSDASAAFLAQPSPSMALRGVTGHFVIDRPSQPAVAAAPSLGGGKKEAPRQPYAAPAVASMGVASNVSAVAGWAFPDSEFPQAVGGEEGDVVAATAMSSVPYFATPPQQLQLQPQQSLDVFASSHGGKGMPVGAVLAAYGGTMGQPQVAYGTPAIAVAELPVVGGFGIPYAQAAAAPEYFTAEPAMLADPQQLLLQQQQQQQQIEQQQQQQEQRLMDAVQFAQTPLFGNFGYGMPAASIGPGHPFASSVGLGEAPFTGGFMGGSGYAFPAQHVATPQLYSTPPGVAGTAMLPPGGMMDPAMVHGMAAGGSAGLAGAYQAPIGLHLGPLFGQATAVPAVSLSGPLHGQPPADRRADGTYSS